MRTAILLIWLTSLAMGQARYPEKTPDTEANHALQRYWEIRVSELEKNGSLRTVRSAEEWQAQAPEARRELFEMLGLHPMPERTPLNPVITGAESGDGYVVEKLHFQSMPQLYVTANFYKPSKTEGKTLPTILYVCGHSVVKKDGVSFGNKAGYHHHGIWFARHGYCCLVIDTLQLGEIPGEHHGTYNLNKWWWVSRGYTSAGVEAWNCIRALDYLETRSEVDKTRFGVTGRSGGGAYSWWVAALDDRIKAAAPTAGITSLRNHVVDGCVEGHCDCMYFVNTYGWDFDRVVALVAPRPLLICNTDKDDIFPVNGVFQTYSSARRLYEMLGAGAKLGLHIAEGPHRDMQPLNVGAFHWFERHLKGADLMDVTEEAAKKSLEPEQLRVFRSLPEDQRNQRIDHEFVPAAAKFEAPSSRDEWVIFREDKMKVLREQVFRAWPRDDVSPAVTSTTVAEAEGVSLSAFDFVSQEPFRLRLYLAHRGGLKLEELDLIALNILDEKGWADFEATYRKAFAAAFTQPAGAESDAAAWNSTHKMFSNFKWGMAYLAPRGVGPTAWTGSDKAQNQRLRRFYLLGETLASTQAYDIWRGIQALRSIKGADKPRLWLTSSGEMAVNTLYASLFEEGIERLDLHSLPASHMSGPTYLNVLRYLDVPVAVAMACERTKVILYGDDKDTWAPVVKTVELLGQAKHLQLRDATPER